MFKIQRYEPFPSNTQPTVYQPQTGILLEGANYVTVELPMAVGNNANCSSLIKFEVTDMWDGVIIAEAGDGTPIIEIVNEVFVINGNPTPTGVKRGKYYEIYLNCSGEPFLSINLKRSYDHVVADKTPSKFRNCILYEFIAGHNDDIIWLSDMQALATSYNSGLGNRTQEIAEYDGFNAAKDRISGACQYHFEFSSNKLMNKGYFRPTRGLSAQYAGQYPVTFLERRPTLDYYIVV